MITDAEDFILEKYPHILMEGHATSAKRLPKDITFITSEELHEMYPDFTVHERETAIVQKHGAVFIQGNVLFELLCIVLTPTFLSLCYLLHLNRNGMAYERWKPS